MPFGSLILLPIPNSSNNSAAASIFQSLVVPQGLRATLWSKIINLIRYKGLISSISARINCRLLPQNWDKKVNISIIHVIKMNLDNNNHMEN